MVVSDLPRHLFISKIPKISSEDTPLRQLDCGDNLEDTCTSSIPDVATAFAVRELIASLIPYSIFFLYDTTVLEY